MTSTMKFLAITALFGALMTPAYAGVGQAVRHGGKLILGKAAQKAAAKSAEHAVKRAGATVLRESSEAAAKRTSATIAARFGDDAFRVGTSTLSKSGTLADDVIAVSSKLTSRNNRRLQMLATQMGKGSQTREMVKTLSKSGRPNEVIEQLWQHRGKLAAGVGAAAVLIHGDDIVNAGGEYLVKPIVEEGMRNVVSPAIATTSRVFVGGLVGLIVAVTLCGLCAVIKPTLFRLAVSRLVSGSKHLRRQTLR